MEKGYIYIRQNLFYDLYNVYKIGKTINIPDRNNQYITGEIIRGNFKNVYEVSIEEMDNIEKRLFKIFSNLNVNLGGGKEFYDKKIIEYIEYFFTENKIEYKKLENQEINELIRKPKIKKEIIPKEYQNDIIQNSINYFETKNKGILVLPCGVGKTLISLWIMKKLDIKTVLIGIPNKSILNQWLNSVKYLFIDVPYLCVSDNIKINDIENFLTTNKNKCIIISTYHSVYKVKEIINNIGFIFDLKILDEVHHVTSKFFNDELEDTKKFITILHIPSNKQLSLTATLKQLEGDIKTISNNNEEYFGEIIDRKCLLWAIKNNIVCDYDIQTIVTNENQIDICDIKEDIDKKLFLSAFVAVKSIYNKDTTHLLIYSNNKNNSKKIIKYIKKILDKFFDIDLYYNEYNSNTKDQQIILDNFNTSNYGIISCVYCLGEGYDNCIIDGIVLSDMKSNIRIVQSSLRACRKNVLNPNKKAKIILPILSKDEWLNNNMDYKNVKEIIYQMGLEDKTIEQKIKVYNIDINKQRTYDIKNMKYNDILTKEIKNLALKTIKRYELYFVSYEKAKKIILQQKIINKNEYYELCENDSRLPKNPDDVYKDNFSNWIDYLGIERKYYNIEKCKEKIKEYIDMYPEIKNKLLDNVNILKKLCEIDNKFPDYELWCDYYGVNSLSDIITISKKIKKIKI